MNFASAVRLKQLLLRAAFYAAGLIAAAALLLAAGFMLAKPKLLALAQREMGKYGIEAQQTDMTLFGYVHMRNVSVPLHQGGALRLESLAVRPPLHFFGRTWLGGAGALYNLRLERGGLAVFVPKLRFSGVALEEKDSAIASRSLQMLMRLRAGSLQADKITLAFAPEETGAAAETAGAPPQAKTLQTVINGFSLSGLSNGKIAAVSYSGMDSDAALPRRGAGAAAEASRARSGAFLARDIDAASLYALARRLAPREENSPAAEIPFPQGARDLAGAIELNKLDITAEDEKLGTVHISADALGSQGFALKGGKTPADFILRLPPDAAGQAPADKTAEKKKIILHNLRGLLADMASVDMNAQNLALQIEPRPEVLAAAEAARKAAAARAAANRGKTVRDILDEEQERAEQKREGDDSGENAESSAAAAGESLKQGLTPLQFKLAVSSFALRANHWEQAIPHNFYLRVKDFTFLPGKNSGGELLQALRDMGHEDLQFSFVSDVVWNPQNSELDMRRVAFYGRDMGGFSLRGTMLDVPKNVFDGKPEAVGAALNEAGIGNMEIRLEDSGFIRNLVQWGTTQITISAAELQEDLHDIAVKSPPLLLKNRKEAQNFSNIFGSFVRDSGVIRVKMSAPQAGGLKLRDIMASQDDLSVLLDKLNLSADRPQQQEPLIE